MRMRETVNQNFLRQPQVLMQNPMAGMRRNGMQNMPPQKTAMLNNAAGMYVMTFLEPPAIGLMEVTAS